MKIFRKSYRQARGWLLAGLIAPSAITAAIPDVHRSYEVTVPNLNAEVEGNDRLTWGYPIGPGRLQQVYSADQFSALPEEGAFIWALWFRADCSGSLSAGLYEPKFVLSTTQKRPDSLSSNFVENIGPDAMRVGIDRPRIAFSIYQGGGDCAAGIPDTFSISSLVLNTPFFYDPRKGNLLLDFSFGWGITEDTFFPRVRLDMQRQLGDSVSRAFWQGINVGDPIPETASVVDTAGLVTFFYFYPRPAFLITVESNAVVLRWSPAPREFKLEYSERLGTGWNPYVGDVVFDNVYQLSKVSWPISTLGETRFFRLFWNSPQIGLPDYVRQAPVQILNAETP